MPAVFGYGGRAMRKPSRFEKLWFWLTHAPATRRLIAAANVVESKLGFYGQFVCGPPAISERAGSSIG